MKKVYSSSDQVIHLFANKSQSEARCKNVYFNDDSIFSYGRHYELGRHTSFNGKPVMLLNTKGYSVTTSKHIRSLRLACDHLTVIECPDLRMNETPDIYSALVEEQNELIDQLFDIFKRRSFYGGYSFAYIGEKYDKFNAKVSLLNCKELFIDYKPMIELINEHVAYCKHKQEQKNTPEMSAKKQAALLKKNTLDLEKWTNGGVLTNSLRNITPQLIRVCEDRLETSRGAIVDLASVKRLVMLVKNKTSVEGFKVGNFNVTKLDGNIITIGCHTFNVDQCLKVLGEK